MSVKGAGLKQIIVQPCDTPGVGECPISGLQTVTVPAGESAKIITDIGELLFVNTNSGRNGGHTDVSLQFQTSLNNWVDLMPAGSTQWQQFFSDGSNLRFQSQDTSTTQGGSYYVVQ